MLAYPKARRRFVVALFNGVMVVSMVVSMVGGAFLPARAAVRVVDPPVQPAATHSYPEGSPMSDEDPTPATLQGLTLLLGEGAAAPPLRPSPAWGWPSRLPTSRLRRCSTVCLRCRLSRSWRHRFSCRPSRCLRRGRARP